MDLIPTYPATLETVTKPGPSRVGEWAKMRKKKVKFEEK